jgi:PIN domain nuclease of toxin-antitoxin system
VTTVLLDSHVGHWWSAEPTRISRTAARALDEADELAVAAISWFELARIAGYAHTATPSR